MTRRQLLRHLRRLGACKDAMLWVHSQRGVAPNALWRSCPEGAWMIWLARVSGVTDWAIYADRSWAQAYLAHPGDDAARDRSDAIAFAKALPWCVVRDALEKQR